MPKIEQSDRRGFLRAAGGITFLALVPDGSGAFAAKIGVGDWAGKSHPIDSKPTGSTDPMPVFTAVPYIQPGSKGSLLVDGSESIVIAWQTDLRPAQFEVTVDGQNGAVIPIRTQRSKGSAEKTGRFNYAATIEGLGLSRRYSYKVTMNGHRLAEGYFTTRKKRGESVRFVAFGDNSYGDISDRMIAYQAYAAKPDFVMNTGDNVYEDGLDDEYARYYFPVYNSDVAAPRIGAPLLRSVPFYTVIANHDVSHRSAEGRPIADFDHSADSLAYYTAMHLPLNGPEQPRHPTPKAGDEAIIELFHQAAGPRFPRMANYSFDFGDGHFLCLDANVYVDPTDAALQAWIEADLQEALEAPWKFVIYHHPAFNVGREHYAEQHMRALSAVFEKHGVSVVLNGHEHVYQRSRPFTFVPGDLSAAKAAGSSHRLTPGTFAIDREFDGDKNTTPRGIVYITTGAGGKTLYDPSQNDNPTNWLHAEDGGADYVAKFVSDRHSLSTIDMDAESLVFRQVDQWGHEIDRIRITK